MPRSHALLLVLVLGGLAAPGRAEAQGFIIPELGARVNGMGAAIGRPDDLSAIYHNPGALALLPGTQLMASCGAAFLATDVQLAPWPGSEPYLTEPLDAQASRPRSPSRARTSSRPSPSVCSCGPTALSAWV